MAGNIKDDSFGNSNNIIIINTIKARKISPSVTPPPLPTPCLSSPFVPLNCRKIIGKKKGANGGEKCECVNFSLDSESLKCPSILCHKINALYERKHKALDFYHQGQQDGHKRIRNMETQRKKIGS